MGAFDQAARYAARTEPVVVLERLLAPCGSALMFRDWYDSRALPLPRGPDRTADLVAIMDDAANTEQPWLFIIEVQTEPDLDKLDVTLEEIAILRSRTRHGPDNADKYQTLAGIVYLQEPAPTDVLAMTLPNGAGTHHAPCIWHVANDDAVSTLEKIAQDAVSWGMLFWVPLMQNGGDIGTINRWKEIVLATVANNNRRNDLAYIATIFAELTPNGLRWKQQLKEFNMRESQLVNEFRSAFQAEGIAMMIIRTLQRKFREAVTPELIATIREQETFDLLQDWNDAAVDATTIDDFLAVMRHG